MFAKAYSIVRGSREKEAVREKMHCWMNSSRSARHSSRSFLHKSTSFCNPRARKPWESEGTHASASFPSLETCTGLKFLCTVNAVNAAAATVTLIPLESMSPKDVVASVALQVGSPTKSPMPISPQQAQQRLAGSAAETPSTTTPLASPPLAAVAADYKGLSEGQSALSTNCIHHLSSGTASKD